MFKCLNVKMRRKFINLGERACGAEKGSAGGRERKKRKHLGENCGINSIQLKNKFIVVRFKEKIFKLV